MKNLKSEKGAITLFVLLACLFFVMSLLGVYNYVQNRNQASNSEYQKVKENYEKNIGNEDTLYSENSVFSTNYGRIEVIWIDKDNNVINNPLAPVLNGMTPVKWSGVIESETTEYDSDWYSYTAITGKGDNTTSRWANAKNSDGSYFVWIPRYAYRITYYESSTSDAITGYCDGDGIRTVGGIVKYELDEGIQTVTYNNIKYIVHPAFETNVDVGGWDLGDLSGIWVAKYEMSRAGASTTSEGTETIFLSLPNKQSARNISIGDIYTYSLNYDRDKESHLIKNSEWGACAYLTHSQYGRNGNEIRINNNSNYITGSAAKTVDESGSTDTYTYDETDTNGKYLGGLASSTGNITGIYDLSGGAMEFVAIFNDTDTNGFTQKYGSSFALTTNNSSRYATKYSNPTSQQSGTTTTYNVGKIGDATKEVFLGGSEWHSWNEDPLCWLSSEYPFLLRGFRYYGGNMAGIFEANPETGAPVSEQSFRVVLAMEY